MSSDPNGWVTNPPSTFVVIQNTSRAELNGQVGVAIQYLQDRYIVVLTQAPRSEPKSFKAEHLRKATWSEQLRAQYTLMMNDPTVQRQMQQILLKVKQMTGLEPQYVVGLLMVLILGSVWFLGFRRTVLLLSFSLMMGMVLVPTYIETNNIKGALQRAPQRLRLILLESNLPFAAKIASSNLYMALLVGLLVAFFVSGMLPQATGPARSQSMTTSAADMSSWFSKANQQVPSIALADMDRFYKLGFDDAIDQRPFGASLSQVKTESIEAQPAQPPGPHRDEAAGEAIDPYDPSFGAIPLPKKSKAASLFTISNAMCVFAIVRTVNELGRDGADGHLDWRRLWANLQVQPVWRLGLLGVSVYRLAAAVFGLV